MGIVNRIRSVIGGPSNQQAEEQADPSHRCQSCGEEYFTNPTVEIPTCRSCGGAKVEAVG